MGFFGSIGKGLKGLGKGIVKGVDKFDDMIKLKELAQIGQFIPGVNVIASPLAQTYAGFDVAKGLKNRDLGQALQGGLSLYGSSKIGTGPQIAIPKPANLLTGQVPDFSSNLSLLDKIGTNVGKYTQGMANPLNLSGNNQALYDTMAAPLVNQAIGGQQQQQQQQQRQGPLVQAPMQRYRPRMAQGGIANADYYSPGSAIVGEAGPEFLTSLNGPQDERAAAGILGLPPMRGGGMIPHLPPDYQGWVNGPHIATLGENGTEAVLPLDKLRTAAGGAITYPMMEHGGLFHFGGKPIGGFGDLYDAITTYKPQEGSVASMQTGDPGFQDALRSEFENTQSVFTPGIGGVGAGMANLGRNILPKTAPWYSKLGQWLGHKGVDMGRGVGISGLPDEALADEALVDQSVIDEQQAPPSPLEDQIPLPEGFDDYELEELAGEMPIDIDPALLDNPNARYWKENDPDRYESMLQGLREQQAAGAEFPVPESPFEVPIETPSPLAGLEDVNLPQGPLTNAQHWLNQDPARWRDMLSQSISPVNNMMQPPSPQPAQLDPSMFGGIPQDPEAERIRQGFAQADAGAFQNPRLYPELYPEEYERSVGQDQENVALLRQMLTGEQIQPGPLDGLTRNQHLELMRLYRE